MTDTMNVEWWPIASVIPYDNNPRIRTDKAVAKVAESIKSFGWQQAIVVDAEGVIVAGHTRRAAAQQLDLDNVPVIVARNLTPEKARAFRIADNRVAEETDWDKDLLALELEALAAIKDLDFDLDALGFDEGELTRLIFANDDGEGEPEDVPEPPKVVATLPGDVWVMGDHKIICGDSTDADVVKQLLGDEKPHLMITDPPYGVEYDANWRNEAVRSDGTPIAGCAVGKVENDDRADWSAAYSLFPGDVAYVWHSPLNGHVFAQSLMDTGFELRSHIVWAKNRMAIGRGDYHWQHEPCYYAVRKGKTASFNGDRTQTTIWNIDKPQKSETGHSTQKPIECMRRPILNNSVIGDAIYEPFSGSGTTIIAAELTQRRCFAIELSPAYVDVAVLRWQAETGEDAMLEATGQSYGEVAAERAAKTKRQPKKRKGIKRPVKAA